MQLIKEPQALHYWKRCKLLPLLGRNDNKTMLGLQSEAAAHSASELAAPSQRLEHCNEKDLVHQVSLELFQEPSNM